MLRALAFLTIYIGICAGANPNFTFTYEMASHCKEHNCQHGYSYDTYYSAPAPAANRSMSLEMHIAIQASSNGHILLSPVSFPETTDPVYEIVVGGGGNKFTELRRNLKRNAKASRPTDKILSAVELRGFYIKITDGGLVEFGQEGSSLPLISYFDTNPLTIKYFSFAAWNGVEAKFLYDCPAPGENGTASSKIVERNLSNSDQLKKELLQDRQPTIPPGMTVTVSLEARVTGVSFNAFEAKLTTRMYLLTVWKDESLAWNPDKFHGITNTTYRQGQIWKPVFHVYNADNINSLKTIGSETISMKSTGEATFHFKAIVQTWCFTESTSYNRWPHDEYACSIVIQPWESHEQIILSTLEDINLLDKLTDDDVIENEWEVTELRQFTVTAAKWNRLYPMQANDTNQSDRFVISIALQRRPTNYNIAFYTPLFVLMTFVLMSFWSEPLQLSRVWFYAGATVFICMGLCFIDCLIPCHTVPTILLLYITVLGGVLLALILQVMMMTSLAEKLFKTTAMQSVLYSRCFRTVFSLPAKTNRSYNTMHEGSSALEEDDASSDIYARNGHIEEMQPEGNKYSEKKEFAEVIDKAMFAVYSILFAAMLAAHY